MREYALDLAAGYAKDAVDQAKIEDQAEAGKAAALESEWTDYAKALDEELQNRVRLAVGTTRPSSIL